MKGHSDAGSAIGNFDLNRQLINVEASAHYYGFFIQGEYFKFDDVVKKRDVGTNTDVETGSSSGWYATSEYVFTDLAYMAPFIRYEEWDRFEGEDGYKVTSALAGVNWYLRGNTTKVGFVYQQDTFDEKTGDKDVQKIRITSQWFF